MGAIWNWLDGKKRNLAHAYWAIVVPSAMVWWPDGIPPTEGKIIAILGIIFTAIGYGHAMVKGENK